jgi:pyridoxine kinase
MKHILSIQSHVASGYVGNRSAVFPLQRLGCEVDFINTVQFSNHTGYGKWSGQIFSAEHIQDILNGLSDNGCLNNLDAILSGYQGSAELGHVIVNTVKALKAQHPQLLYCCDPVIGDHDRGVYVRQDSADFIKRHAIETADIITPNQFELGYLTDSELASLDSILEACQRLHARGPKIILVTSIICDEILNSIGMLVSCAQGVWLTKTPYLAFPRSPVGTGDATTAIFLAQYLMSQDIVFALEHVTAAIYNILHLTYKQQRYELALIAAQEEIVRPSQWFQAVQVTSAMLSQL